MSIFQVVSNFRKNLTTNVKIKFTKKSKLQL